MAGKAKNFLGMSAPPGYVPGLGRGASGFTTRSDIGPARDSDMDLPSEAEVRKAVSKMRQDGDNDGENLNDTNYDEFSGYGGSLFAGGNYDDDDKEADQIYDAIEVRQDEKRKAHRERQMKETLLKFRKERPKIQQQFADLKRQLTDVSSEEWANLPDVADIGKKVKKKKYDRYSLNSDSFILGARNAQTSLHLAADFGTQTSMPGTSTAFPGTQTAFPGTQTAFPGTQTSFPGTQTSFGGTQTAYPGTGTAYPGIGTAYPGTQTAQPGFSGELDVGEIGHARKVMMGVKLDQAGDSITGQTVVDAKGYLTDLNTLTPKNLGNIGDVKKGRLLLKSVRSTNPKHAPAWIASAGLEEITGKIQAARNLIMKGTEACPQSEEIWLEAIRLMPPEQQKSVAAQAIGACSNSVKLWIRACDLEADKKAKRAVLRKALETVPDSVRLWKAAISLEEEVDAKVLLQGAVECCPLSVELWLALARLETYENAQKVLNRARKNVPTDRAIWITAARLEEEAGKASNVARLIKTGVKSLRANGVEINRDEWIKEAEKCEKQGNIETAQSIIREIIGEGVEDEERKSQWLEDAENSVTNESYACARAVYAHMLTCFKADDSIWLQAAYFEREHGTRESLDQHLQQATRYCPQAEVLWLMGAKSQWMAGDVNAAREILSQAFSANPNSEDIWLAAIKLESENNEFQRAQVLLANARKQANTALVWMKSARLEWVMGNLDAARKLLDVALTTHEAEPKLWMMRGQIEEQDENIDTARNFYAQGRKHCKTSIPLWLLASRLEHSQNNITRARSIMEKARATLPHCPEFFLEGCRIELAAGFKSNSDALLAKALQECPTSGLLWSNAIMLAAKAQRKTKSVDALKKCENDPRVMLMVARYFQSERKTAKARTWFNRTIKLDPDLGDAWAAYYAFELQYGSEAQQEQVAKHCRQAEPRHGELWQQCAKDVKNWKRSADEILKLTSAKIEEI